MTGSTAPLPVLRVADYEITEGWKLGDIKTCAEANDAIAILTEQVKVLHGRRVENRVKLGTETAFTEICGLLKSKEAALNFAYGIRRDLGGETPKHKVKGREVIAYRMIAILKEAFPDVYEKVELIYQNDPRRQMEKR